MKNLSVFESLESNVRMYCRDIPVVFDKAIGTKMYCENGHEYLDFFAGAGALNYGHNSPDMVQAMIEHLSNNHVSHGLDLHTKTKRNLLTTIQETLLSPKKWDYKVQFTGPTGADANEAALKLARKYTGRSRIVSFYGAYHGMTAGALSISGNRSRRGNDHSLSNDVTFLPYEDGMHGEYDSIALLDRMAADMGSGTELPAAVIVESIQIQAGVFSASKEWLQRLRKWTDDHGVVLIMDEVQAGCGRSGAFFGFEHAGIMPDIITCAKSIGGSGLPMALLFIKSSLDIWAPGEHTGTFRGNQLAFVTAQIAFNYWRDEVFLASINENVQMMAQFLESYKQYSIVKATRYHGLIAGIDFGLGNVEIAKKVQQAALEHGVIVERCGPAGEVIKLMPPINTPAQELEKGLDIIAKAIQAFA